MACYSTARFDTEVSPDSLCSRLQALRSDILNTSTRRLPLFERIGLSRAIRQLASRLTIVAEQAWATRCGKHSVLPSASGTDVDQGMPSDVAYRSPYPYPHRDQLLDLFRVCWRMQDRLSHHHTPPSSLSAVDVDWLQELELRTRAIAFDLLTELARKVDEGPIVVSRPPLSRSWSDFESSIPDLESDDNVSLPSSPPTPAMSLVDVCLWPKTGK